MRRKGLSLVPMDVQEFLRLCHEGKIMPMMQNEFLKIHPAPPKGKPTGEPITGEEVIDWAKKHGMIICCDREDHEIVRLRYDPVLREMQRVVEEMYAWHL